MERVGDTGGVGFHDGDDFDRNAKIGLFGIKAFDAVINPPHATILPVGAGEKRPVVVGDEVRIATIMSCTLSCDHRVVDGALGAELLNAFKAYIDDPVKMLV